MSNPFEDIQSIVAYRPQPGDVLFFIHPGILSQGAMENIKRSWLEASKGTALEGVRIAVLQEGMRPELLRAADVHVGKL